MPHITTVDVFISPSCTCYFIRYGARRIVLIATHYFQYSIGVVGNRIETYQLVSHRDREKTVGYFVPFVYGFVVKVTPVEKIIGIEFAVRAWIGKV